MKRNSYIEPIATPAQKKIGSVAFAIMGLFTLYYCVMTVGRFICDWSGSIYFNIEKALGYAAFAAEAIYAFYVCFAHPMKKSSRKKFLSRFFSVEVILLLVMVVLYLFSCASMNGRYTATNWWEANQDALFDFLSQVFILVPFGILLVDSFQKRYVRITIHSIVLIAAALGAYIIYRVFIKQPIIDSTFNIGMTSGSRLVINCNPNTTGLWGYCLAFIAISLMTTSNKYMKPVCIIEALVGVGLISLSQSRASIIGLGLTIGLMAAVFLYRKSDMTMKKIGSVAAGAICAVIAIYMITGAFELYSRATQPPTAAMSSSGVTNAQNAAVEHTESTQKASRELIDSTLSNRTAVWKASVDAMLYDTRSFMFGVTPVGVPGWLDMIRGTDNYMYTHNQILEEGVALGVPGMLVFCALGVMLVIDSVKVCFRKELPYSATLASSGLFLMLIANMVEATLLCMNFLSGALFAILCGVLIRRKNDIAQILKK